MRKRAVVFTKGKKGGSLVRVRSVARSFFSRSPVLADRETQIDTHTHARTHTHTHTHTLVPTDREQTGSHER